MRRRLDSVIKSDRRYGSWIPEHRLCAFLIVLFLKRLKEIGMQVSHDPGWFERRLGFQARRAECTSKGKKEKKKKTSRSRYW